MKRLLVAITAGALLITALSVNMPVGAADNPIFEANIVDGAYPVHPIDKGEVKVYADGTFVIKIEGTKANETYKVSVGRWMGTNAPNWIYWKKILVDNDGDPLTMTTDEEGEGSVSGSLPSGHWSLFGLNDATQDEDPLPAGINRFVSGFQAP